MYPERVTPSAPVQKAELQQGEARALLSQVPDESIRLIISVGAGVKDYLWLEQEATRKLSKEGNILVFTPQTILPQVIRALSKEPKLLAVQYNLFAKPVVEHVLWFGSGVTVKSKVNRRHMIPPTFTAFYGLTTTPDPRYLQLLLEIFTEEGETVLDPFMLDGRVLEPACAMGRRCFGFESDKYLLERAGERLEHPAMPVALGIG